MVEKTVNKQMLDLDATEIAKLIRERKLTSEQITKLLIRHIQTVNPSLNAVVEDRFDEAIKEAKEKDENIDEANFLKQPLYGVPISIKESFHVKGMKTTGGIVHRQDLIMTEDAIVVDKLKKAGAIILVKTNTPSLCFYHETDNKLYGRTNNAWNKEMSAGGSSGGEAALIAVGGTPVGMSSDIGGSIRIPSHFNGVVGFKPGKEQVSAVGHYPETTIPLQQRMLSIGPIGKSVRDTQLVYNIVANGQKRKYLYEKMSVDILPADNGFPLSESTAKKLDDIYTFISQKYDTTYAIPPYFTDSSRIWQEIMSIDGVKDLIEIAFRSDRPNLWKAYTKEKLTKKTDVHEYLTWAFIGANLFKPSQKRTKEIEQFVKACDPELNRHFNKRILIMPVYHTGALKHGEMYKEIFAINKTYVKYMPYLAYANVWGLPSLIVPVGVDDRSMPIGVQLISKNGNEDALFQLGKEIEKQFGGFKRSTVYD